MLSAKGRENRPGEFQPTAFPLWNKRAPEVCSGRVPLEVCVIAEFAHGKKLGFIVRLRTTMQRANGPTSSARIGTSDARNRHPLTRPAEAGALAYTNYIAAGVTDLLVDVASPLVHQSVAASGGPGGDSQDSPGAMPITVAEFVERVFIPKYVMTKRAAGRAHFQAILKHVLSPERVAQAFRSANVSKARLSAVPGWPYLDEMQISEVRPADVEELIKACIEHGYSSQMATHLRNVIRNMFSCAVSHGYYAGSNPATLVAAPAIARKPVPILTLSQLRQVLGLMRYPEQHIALFALLTDMNMAEICGLKWKFVNLSNEAHYLSGDCVPPRTIMVKMQSYRGEHRAVIGKRNRQLPIQDLLYSTIQQLRYRTKYVSSEDFVLTSRRGTPINPDNIATRRLKWIASKLEMPWMSWKVFHRTGISLRAQFGRYLNKELEKTLPLKR